MPAPVSNPRPASRTTPKCTTICMRPRERSWHDFSSSLFPPPLRVSAISGSSRAPLGPRCLLPYRTRARHHRPLHSFPPPPSSHLGASGMIFPLRVFLRLSASPRLVGALAHPWGVDACSRIESAPGIKDHTKMHDYMHAAKGALVA